MNPNIRRPESLRVPDGLGPFLGAQWERLARDVEAARGALTSDERDGLRVLVTQLAEFQEHRVHVRRYLALGRTPPPSVRDAMLSARAAARGGAAWCGFISPEQLDDAPTDDGRDIVLDTLADSRRRFGVLPREEESIR